MNREILFRGKRKDNNEWIEGFINYCDFHNAKQEQFREYYIIFQDQYQYEVIPETICQYTGLTDKNGKKIFEGDICIGNGHIEKDDEKFIIKYGKYKTEEWKEKYSCNTYQFGWYAEFINSKSQVHLVIPNGIEVIGNIYESKINE